MKTKNKKIFALLCFPVLVIMMILPLCSFTTSNSYPWDFTIYESKTQCDLTYRFYRGGSYGYYYGTIPSANRVLISNEALATNSITSIRDSIEFIADDLLMTGTKSIDIRAFSNNDLGSSLIRPSSSPDDLYLGITYVTDDYTTSALDGVFYFRNYIASDDIRLNIFDINNQIIDYAQNTVSCTATVYVSEFNYSNNTFENDSYILNEPLNYYIGSDVTSATDIVLNDIVDSVLDYYTLALGENAFVSNVELMLTYTTESGADFGFGAVRLKSFINPVNVDTFYGQDLEDLISEIASNVYQFAYDEGVEYGRDFGYESGYDLGLVHGEQSGYEKGVQDGVKSFESIGEFLKTSVGAFFSFKLWDGFTLGSVMSIFVGAMLLVAFLKIFAGG